VLVPVRSWEKLITTVQIIFGQILTPRANSVLIYEMNRLDYCS
jgi:hypothetical protein